MSSLSWDYISKNKANKQFSFYFYFFSTGPTRPKQTSAWRPARHFHPSSLASGLLLVLETPRCSVPHQTHSSLLPLSLWNSYRGLCNFSIPKLYNQVPAQWTVQLVGANTRQMISAEVIHVAAFSLTAFMSCQVTHIPRMCCRLLSVC